MALAFNLQRTGPLAQVSIGLGELMAAYQIATGAYGWWKARERTESLVHLLESSRCSLSAPSSFNHDVYIQVRTDYGKMQGVVVQNNTVCSVPLPRASTALPNDRGQACLRAVTAAILSLYMTDTTTEILRQIIPYALLHCELDDLDISFEDGPLVPALKHWVISVATEEDSDLIRDYLLRQVATDEHNLSGVPVEHIMNQNLREQKSEVPFVIGVIKWCLTPKPQRKFSKYATRSLRAWSMASLLFKLGFDIIPVTYIASTPSDCRSTCPGEAPEVYLVACTGIDTDYLACAFHIEESPKTIRPCITPLSGVPVLAFRHLSGKPYNMDISKLQEVFEISFVKARESYMNNMGLFGITHSFEKLCPHEMPDLHKRLSRLFIKGASLHGLYLLYCPAMSEYIPSTYEDDASWSPELIGVYLSNSHYTHENTALHSKAFYNAYVLKAIVLGTLYGGCSNLIISPENGMQIFQQDISFIPSIVRPENFCYLQRWAEPAKITLIKGYRSPESRYLSLLANIFLGSPCRLDDVVPLGVHMHGLTLLSELVVYPTILGEATCRYYLLRGQPLNLPTDEHGIFRTADCSSPKHYELKRKSPLTTLQVCDKFKQGHTLRIDTEPSWNTAPQALIWKIRRNGVPLATIPIFASPMTYEPCRCGQYASSVTVPQDSYIRWHLMTIDDLVRGAPKATIVRVANYLVDASASEATTTLAVGLCRGYPHAVVWDCFQCAFEKLETSYEAYRGGLAGILVVAWTFHNRKTQRHGDT